MSAYIHNTKVSSMFDLSITQSTLAQTVAQSVQPTLRPGDIHTTLVTIPTNQGPFTTRLSFVIVDKEEPSIILGADWSASFLGYVSARYTQTLNIAERAHSNHLDKMSNNNIELALLHNTLQTDTNHLDECFNKPSSALYVFQDNVIVLHAYMTYHGMDNVLEGVEECQEKLIHHLLSAACMVPTPDKPQRLACSQLSKHFRHSLHMAHEAYNALLRSSTISLSHLRIAWKAVGSEPNLWRYEYSELRAMLHVQHTSIIKTFSRLHPSKETIQSLYSMRKPQLVELACVHGISLLYALPRIQIQRTLLNHIVNGKCLIAQHNPPLGCAALQDDLRCDDMSNDHDTTVGVAQSPDDHLLLRREMNKVLIDTLRRPDFDAFLDTLHLSVPEGADLKSRRSLAHAEILRLEGLSSQVSRIDPYTAIHPETREWPTILSQEDKDTLISNFLDETSSSSLAKGVCGICSAYVERNILSRVCAAELPLHLLSRHGHNYGVTFLPDSSFPCTIAQGLLSPYLIDPMAVHNTNAESLDEIFIDTCRSCHGKLTNGRLPSTALANGTFVGTPPLELKGLSIVEEAMIALSRTKCMIVQLREVESNRSSPINQKAIKGNVIVYPQDTSSISAILPPSLADMASLICVMFVGSLALSDEILLRSTPLAVRGDKVLRALRWLKLNNPLYYDIKINEAVISEVEKIGYIPFHVERVESSQKFSTLVSRYDETDEADGDQFSKPVSGKACSSENIPFESVLITGVDPIAPPNVLRAAALKHLKDGRGNFIRIPHDHTPVNSFDNPRMFPMMFPSLFPYGVGGFEDKARSTKLSMKIHVKHLLNLFDKRFQEHHGFMFSSFNILQRRESLLRISLRTKHSSFQDIASQLTSISSDCVHRIYERLKSGGPFVSANDQEARVFKLMQEVNIVNRGVPGSPSSKVAMRNEIRAMMLEKGMPSFFITLNPADVYNPIVKFLSGSEINIDDMRSTEIPTYWTQALLVARNPCLGARFFNLYMKAFIQCLLGYRPDGYDQYSTGGVLGFTTAYYGCVEAQGRGTLHCHMLVWLDGALNPDEIKRKLLADNDFAARFLRYLEDNIDTSIPPASEVAVPSDEVHPSSIRSTYPHMSQFAQQRSKDFHNVVKSSQTHKHSHTCFKYCHGSTRECRFGLGIERERPESSISEDGVIHLRCINGLVNNYNPVMLEALRCNMDIKFIGSGVSAKAALYYITDYITKSDEKSYTSYAALEMAVRRTEETAVTTGLASRSKQLLQKCASAMISRQELSAPFVATYLLGLDDHYTSHAFRHLYWTSFERYLDTALDRLQKTEDIDHEDDAIVIDQSELVFDVDADGVLAPTATQVEDYVYRSPTLDKFSVWDIMAQSNKKLMRGPPSANIHPFLSGHRDRKTHALSLLRRTRIPVPVGPGLPRRDRAETSERHAKIMLILFKPWRVVTDLKSSTESWIESFNLFIQLASKHTLFVMDNMQLLHECRDSRDDHFIAMRKARGFDGLVSRGPSTSENDEQNIDEPLDESEMIDHLEQVDQFHSSSLSRNRLGVTESLLSAVESGLVEQLYIPSSDASVHQDSGNVVSLNSGENQTDRNIELQWKKEYKDLAAVPDTPQTEVAMSIHPSQAFSASISNHTLGAPELPSIVRGSSMTEPTGEEIINHIKADYTLNKEQMRAFRIVANHSLQLDSKQLKMYLMGHGGTGKSRVIHALTDFFSRRGQSRRFMIGAFTGVAAMHIGGGTLHSMMNLNSELKSGRSKGKTNAKSFRKLIAKWEDVDYLLIDEISMVGCILLHDISEALMVAKGSNQSFGGVNVIFCGDFAQLPPVKQCALFTQIDSRARRISSKKKPSNSSNSPDTAMLLGRNLWLEVDCVVELTEIMRQSGPENAYFIALLNRVRDGKCTEEDYRRLNERLVTKVNPDWTSKAWSDTPVIVYSNAMKDALNIALTSSFAERNDKPFHWYHSEDSHLGVPISNAELRTELYRVDSGRSQQRMGRLPLVEGMPVMVTQNYAVEFGVANGSLGRLNKIRYETNQFGERAAISCTVSLPDAKIKFTGLQQGEVPVFQDDIHMVFVHPHSKRKCTIKRKQLCLMPGFAFTAHKAEGMTLSHVVVDVESCKGIESVYVMLSRVKSLDGLLLLRPFGMNKIRCRPSEDRRLETERLRVLCLETICKYGDPSEIREATISLRTLRNDPSSGLNRFGKRSRESM